MEGLYGGKMEYYIFNRPIIFNLLVCWQVLEKHLLSNVIV